MNKTILKGTGSSIIGLLVFGFMFFWNESSDIFEFLIWGSVSGVLGYLLISCLLMSDKEMEDFEEKIDEAFEDDKK